MNPTPEYCRSLSFNELRIVLDTILSRLRDPSRLLSTQAHREMLRNLCDVLEGKIRRYARPTPPKRPDPFPEFRPDDSVSVKLRREYNDALRSYKLAQRESSKRKWRFKLGRLRAQLDEHEGPMGREYNERKQQYFRDYERERARYEVRRRHESGIVSERIKIVARIRREIQSLLSNSTNLPANRVAWRFLPAGEWNVRTLIDHYERLKMRDPGVPYQRERLIAAENLKPHCCYIGEGEFDWYIAFQFPYTEKTLLECPIFGNAAYILRRNWRELSKLSKRELLIDHRRDVSRIIHTSDWLDRIRNQLGFHSTRAGQVYLQRAESGAGPTVA